MLLVGGGHCRRRMQPWDLPCMLLPAGEADDAVAPLGKMLLRVKGRRGQVEGGGKGRSTRCPEAGQQHAADLRGMGPRNLCSIQESKNSQVSCLASENVQPGASADAGCLSVCPQFPDIGGPVSSGASAWYCPRPGAGGRRSPGLLGQQRDLRGTSKEGLAASRPDRGGVGGVVQRAAREVATADDELDGTGGRYRRHGDGPFLP